MVKSVVSISQGDISGKMIEETIRLAGGLGRVIKEGDTVLIKPNVTAGYLPESGGTTRPIVVKKIIEEIRKFNPDKIIIAENAGTTCDTFESYEKCGWMQLARDMGVEIIDLEKSETVEVSLHNPLFRDALKLPKIILDVDALINVPVLKTHHATGVSVALKNMFGILSNMDKTQAHKDNLIEQAITEVNTIRRPDFTVVDGLIALEGLAGGLDLKHPVNMNLIIAGYDPVAIDAVCTKIMMFQPKVRHIAWWHDKGVGTSNIEDIEVRGLPIEKVMRKFKTPIEQIQEELPMVKIVGEGRCSGCHCAVATALGSPRDQLGYGQPKIKNFMKRGITIYLEPSEAGQSSETKLIIGDCLEKYKDCGIYLPGCPPTPHQIRATIKQVACEGVSVF